MVNNLHQPPVNPNRHQTPLTISNHHRNCHHNRCLSTHGYNLSSRWQYIVAWDNSPATTTHGYDLSSRARQLPRDNNARNHHRNCYHHRWLSTHRYNTVTATTTAVWQHTATIYCRGVSCASSSAAAALSTCPTTQSRPTAVQIRRYGFRCSRPHQCSRGFCGPQSSVQQQQ